MDSEQQQGGIIRVRKDRDNPYAQIRRATLEDEPLSWEARGVLGYLLCKPDDWQLRVNDLINRGPGGRERMYRILKELEINGYIRRVCEQGANGKFVWFTEVYEAPQVQESDLPYTENPYTVKPLTEKPQHTNNEASLITNLERETPAPVATQERPVTPVPKKQRKPPAVETPLPADFTVTADMVAWAKERGIPPAIIARETEKFKDGALARGRTYKDWPAAWRMWMQRIDDFPSTNGNGKHEPPPQRAGRNLADLLNRSAS
jgi:hypothetical protein